MLTSQWCHLVGPSVSYAPRLPGLVCSMSAVLRGMDAAEWVQLLENGVQTLQIAITWTWLGECCAIVVASNVTALLTCVGKYSSQMWSLLAMSEHLGSRIFSDEQIRRIRGKIYLAQSLRQSVSKLLCRIFKSHQHYRAYECSGGLQPFGSLVHYDDIWLRFCLHHHNKLRCSLSWSWAQHQFSMFML